MRMAEAGILSDDDTVELIDGQIVEMSPENSPHRVCIAKINRVLVRELEGTRCFVQPQSTLPLDEHNLPEPDLAILRGTPDDLLGGEQDATLVVEVADTSLERDRALKQSLYAGAGIPMYWLVNLRDRTLEVYRNPDGDTYRERRTLKGEDTVPLQDDLTTTVAVADLLPAPPDA